MSSATLAEMHLFTGLEPDVMQPILQRLYRRTYQVGESIFVTGDDATCLFILESGILKVSYITPNGDEKILNLFEKGDIFGELFLGKYRYRIGLALAVTECVVYQLNETVLYDLIKQHPHIGVNFIKHLVNSQREALARMHALMRTDARCRLLGIFLSLARQMCCTQGHQFILNDKITQEDIANLAGLNRSTVSSLINQFRREGLLGGRGRTVTVNVPAVEAALQEDGFEVLT